ncbi:hypothetical protein ESP57_10875 [Agromyces fucosus]|uniref:2-oxoglutarate dehydrogenase n=1 Tax=Agromyces fucosus TaxID=41985 RepID=A0A4Q2JR21_9MICO|nr:DUF6049 family protein [Agromyces fucosus]RXZ49406.1 hypothetical protein ESP57_10875 [Agromyces fucosus]
MVPESNPARRRCSRVESTDGAQRSPSSPSSPLRGRSRRHGLTAFGAAIAAASMLAAAPLAANAASLAVTSASAAAHGARSMPTETREVTEVILRVAPTIATSIATDAPVTFDVEIENATSEPVAAGTLRLVRSAAPIDDTAELDAWLAQAPDAEAPSAEAPASDAPAAEAAELDGVDVADVPSTTVAPGAVEVVSITLPPEAIDALDDSPVLGFGAELFVGGTVVSSSTEVFANAAAPVTSSTTVALAVPVTVPASAAGLLGADDLATWTSPFGLLSRQLDAVEGRPVAIGIDPRIIASVRVLGTSAPSTATSWLERLAGLPNEIFPLAYADADVAAQAQLGVPALLGPTSFSDVLDPANFSGTADAAGENPGEPADGDAVPSATPVPTQPAAGEVPTTEDLLAWPYTRTDIAWPADDTITAGDLAFLGTAGLTSSILAPGNVVPAEQWVNAASNVDGSSAVVADGRLTAPLRAATEAVSDTEWRAATGRLGAELALLDDGGADQPATLLATLGRGAGTQSARVSATLDELAANPRVTPASLTDAIGAPPVARTLVDEPEDRQRIDNVDRILRTDANVTAFATVLDDPEDITGPTRRDALALLDVAWLDDRPAWDAAVGEWLVAQRRTLDAVSIVPSSPINVVSSETGVPTTILNALPYPVTVVVDVRPSNGRLVVEDQVEVEIDPESRSTVTVPVAAGIGNGEVTLTVSLTSPEGVPVGSPVSIPVNVQADWEGLGAAIIGVIVVVFFGVGIWRNIRRHRKRKAEAAETEENDDADAAVETDAAEPAEADGSARVPEAEQTVARGDEQGDGRRDG